MSNNFEIVVPPPTVELRRNKILLGRFLNEEGGWEYHPLGYATSTGNKYKTLQEAITNLDLNVSNIDIDTKADEELFKVEHKMLDKLVSKYLLNTGKLMSETSVMDLLEWSSNRQEQNHG